MAAEQVDQPFIFMVPCVQGGKLVSVTYYDAAVRAWAEIQRRTGRVS